MSPFYGREKKEREIYDWSKLLLGVVGPGAAGGDVLAVFLKRSGLSFRSQIKASLKPPPLRG